MITTTKHLTYKHNDYSTPRTYSYKPDLSNSRMPWRRCSNSCSVAPRGTHALLEIWSEFRVRSSPGTAVPAASRLSDLTPAKTQTPGPQSGRLSGKAAPFVRKEMLFGKLYLINKYWIFPLFVFAVLVFLALNLWRSVTGTYSLTIWN